MQVDLAFFSQHFELPYRTNKNEEVWAHLVHSDPLADATTGGMLDAFECLILQYGLHIPICIEAVPSIEICAKDVAVEQTEEQVWLVDPLSYIDFGVRAANPAPRIYLVSDSMYHQMSESFYPATPVPFEELIRDTACDNGLFYALTETASAVK